MVIAFWWAWQECRLLLLAQESSASSYFPPSVRWKTVAKGFYHSVQRMLKKVEPTLQAIRPSTRQTPSSDSRQQACGSLALKHTGMLTSSQKSEKTMRRRIGQSCPGCREWLRIEYHRKFGGAPPAAIHDGRRVWRPRGNLVDALNLPLLTSRWSTRSSPALWRHGGEWVLWAWCVGQPTMARRTLLGPSRGGRRQGSPSPSCEPRYTHRQHPITITTTTCAPYEWSFFNEDVQLFQHFSYF